MTKAVIYVRISQDRTGAGLGVERQREDCQALAKRMDFDIVETYADNDISAFSGKRRPGYRQMLDDLEAGTATVVLAWHTDRLHRSPTELEEYIALSERRGIATHTVQAGIIDLSTPSGRMTARILGAVARQESEHKGERIRRARQQAAVAGRWSGGIRPFGWGIPTGETRTRVQRRTGETTTVPVYDTDKAHPIEGPMVAEETDAILGGASLRSRIDALAARGVTTTLGNAWSTTEYRSMLMRPRNAGIATYRGTEVGRGAWDALVAEDRFRAVVMLLSDPARSTAPGNQPRWLGSGIYGCGFDGCGLTMRVTQSGGRAQPTYVCETRSHYGRHAGHLDFFVTSLIIERLARADAVDLLLPAPGGVDVAAVQIEAEVVRQRLTDLAGMFATGAIDAAQLRTGSDIANGQLAALNAQLARAATRSPLVGLVGAPDVRAAWAALDLGRQRAVLRALLTVTVHRARPGRPSGYMPGSDMGYFDASTIGIDWRV